jgi:hypothetical protein
MIRVGMCPLLDITIAGLQMAHQLSHLRIVQHHVSCQDAPHAGARPLLLHHYRLAEDRSIKFHRASHHLAFKAQLVTVPFSLPCRHHQTGTSVVAAY